MKPVTIEDDMNVTTNGDLSRRTFLQFTGTGLVVFFCAGPLEAWQAAFQVPPTYTEPPKNTVPTDFNAFLQIGADGRVTCLVGRVELGQGSKTSFAQLLADELAVAFDSVDVIAGDTDVCPWDVGTFGSQSMRILGPIVRGAAAEARAVLLQMAAEQFKAPVERLQVSEGVITDAAQGKRVTYGEFVQGPLPLARRVHAEAHQDGGLRAGNWLLPEPHASEEAAKYLREAKVETPPPVVAEGK